MLKSAQLLEADDDEEAAAATGAVVGGRGGAIADGAGPISGSGGWAAVGVVGVIRALPILGGGPEVAAALRRLSGTSDSGIFSA